MRKLALLFAFVAARALFAQSTDVGITRFYTDDRTTLATGERVSVNVFWKNFGSIPAESVTVEFGAGSGAFFITGAGTEHWPCQPTVGGNSFVCSGHIAPGDEAHMVATMRTPAHGTSFSLTATVRAVTPDPNLQNNTRTLTYQLARSSTHAELQVSPSSQTHNGAPGSPVTVPVNVVNAGPDTARNLIAVVNFEPGRLVRVNASGAGWTCLHPEDAPWVMLCTRPQLGPGVSAPITVQTTIPEQAGAHRIGMRVSAERGYDPVPANDQMLVTLNDSGVPPVQPEAWKRILVPLIPVTAPGVNGALWRAETTMLIRSDVAIPVGSTTSLPINVPFDASTFLTPRNNSIGQFIYVRASDEAKLSMNSRVWDASREAQTAGAGIPTVREHKFRSTTQAIVGIPVAPHYRHTLRVYDFDGRSGTPVTIRLYANDELTPRATVQRTLTVATDANADPLMPHSPAFLQLDPATLGAIAGASTMRIEVEPLQQDVRLWAFVSVTNNETHHVTTFSVN
ncbi:MAG TPA: hypothetical protein VF846_03230 [Thermoanaerobaculia bacterium]|jgi:hypothetical protein